LYIFHLWEIFYLFLKNIGPKRPITALISPDKISSIAPHHRIISQQRVEHVRHHTRRSNRVPPGPEEDPQTAVGVMACDCRLPSGDDGRSRYSRLSDLGYDCLCHLDHPADYCCRFCLPGPLPPLWRVLPYPRTDISPLSPLPPLRPSCERGQKSPRSRTSKGEIRKKGLTGHFEEIFDTVTAAQRVFQQPERLRIALNR